MSIVSLRCIKGNAPAAVLVQRGRTPTKAAFERRAGQRQWPASLVQPQGVGGPMGSGGCCCRSSVSMELLEEMLDGSASALANAAALLESGSGIACFAIDAAAFTELGNERAPEKIFDGRLQLFAHGANFPSDRLFHYSHSPKMIVSPPKLATKATIAHLMKRCKLHAVWCGDC